MSGSQDGPCQSSFAHGVGGCGISVWGDPVVVSSERGGTVSKNLTLGAGWSSGGLGCGEGGHVSCLCGGDFRGVLDLDGCYQIGDGSDGQVVGQDAESAGVGRVRDADFLALRVDVSVAADLVAESIAEVGGGLSGVSVAEAGLAELILRVVLAGRVRWVAVVSGEGGRDGSSDGSGSLDGADSSVRVSGERISSVVSTVSTESVAVAESGTEPLGLCCHSQHQKASNLILII